MIISWNQKNIINIASYFLHDQLVILPTDTLYGTLAIADNKKAVEKVYKLKKRNPVKPFIILIDSLDDLKKFGVIPSSWQLNKIKEYWPGPVSIILSCDHESLAYLHRGTKTLAFRLPADKKLRGLLKQTGPLIAPSANPEGMDPALNIEQAQKYFGGKVSLYVDGGQKNSSPSTLISLVGDKLNILRGQIKS